MDKNCFDQHLIVNLILWLIMINSLMLYMFTSLKGYYVKVNFCHFLVAREMLQSFR